MSTLSNVRNNPQAQTGGRTVLVPDSPYVFIGGQRFRVQVLKGDGSYEDSHIDSKNLALVQKTYERVFNDMNPDVQDRITKAYDNREVVIFDHTRDGEVSSLSTVSRDSYDQGMPLPSGNPALRVNSLFKRELGKHAPELKAIGQALRAAPRKELPTPDEFPSYQSLCGLSNEGMRKLTNTLACASSVVQNHITPDQALVNLATSDHETRKQIEDLADNLDITATELIQDPFLIYRMISHLRITDPADNQDDVPEIPAQTLRGHDPQEIVEKAMNYLRDNPNAVYEVPIQLIGGTDEPIEALKIMTEISNRLGTSNYYETATHPSRRLVFLDMFAPPIQPQQQNPVAPIAQDPRRQAVDRYYGGLEEAEELNEAIADENADSNFEQIAGAIRKRIIVYNENTDKYSVHTPNDMDENAPFDSEDICLKINTDNELMQMVAKNVDVDDNNEDDDD